MTTREDIKQWLERADPEDTHMIVVCDTYDWDDYPVFVKNNQDVREIEKEYQGKSMQKVMEVYRLDLDHEQQLDSGRSFNY